MKFLHGFFMLNFCHEQEINGIVAYALMDQSALRGGGAIRGNATGANKRVA
jgi:hypothetical protein